MAIYMATTQISAKKTAAQLTEILASVGAQAVMTEYDENSEVKSVAFRLIRNEQVMNFSLPVRWTVVLKAMNKDKRTPGHLCRNDQARRVAWRQIFRWVQAQLALIEVGCVKVEEVFLPYLQIGKNGQTLFEKLEVSPQFLLKGE